jgi:hypothetical protein
MAIRNDEKGSKVNLRDFEFGNPKVNAAGFSCCGKPVGCTIKSDGCAYLHHPWKRAHVFGDPTVRCQAKSIGPYPIDATPHSWIGTALDRKTCKKCGITIRQDGRVYPENYSVLSGPQPYAAPPCGGGDIMEWPCSLKHGHEGECVPEPIRVR